MCLPTVSMTQYFDLSKFLCLIAAYKYALYIIIQILLHEALCPLKLKCCPFTELGCKEADKV